MLKIKIDKSTKDQFISLWKEKKIGIEGNILKLINTEGDNELKKYVDEAIDKDKENRKKRLEITKKIQEQNKELLDWKVKNEDITEKLSIALKKAETSNAETILAKQKVEEALSEAHKSRIEAENSKNEAEQSRKEAEEAKLVAINDLELLQKKTQFELIGTIVKVALGVIMGVGLIVTIVYIIYLILGIDSSVIESSWTNIMGILITNAFSIVGTLMGMKHKQQSN